MLFYLCFELSMLEKEYRLQDFKKSIAYRIIYIVSYFRFWQSSCGGPPNYCAWRSGTRGPRKGMFTALGLFYRRSQTGLPLLTVTTWWHLVRNIILRPYKEKTPDEDIITRNKWNILFTVYWLWVDYNWFDIFLGISKLECMVSWPVSFNCRRSSQGKKWRETAIQTGNQRKLLGKPQFVDDRMLVGKPRQQTHIWRHCQKIQNNIQVSWYM